MPAPAGQWARRCTQETDECQEPADRGYDKLAVDPTCWPGRPRAQKDAALAELMSGCLQEFKIEDLNEGTFAVSLIDAKAAGTLRDMHPCFLTATECKVTHLPVVLLQQVVKTEVQDSEPPKQAC